MKTHKITAAEAYRSQACEMTEKLSKLNEKLAEHALKAKGDPRSWGYVGDLAYWNELLDRIVNPEE